MRYTPGEEWLPHRKVYCGTCKSILHQYGQGARMALNYDVVFLGELLFHIQKRPPAFELPEPSINFRCLQDPFKNESDAVLDYLATVNVFLAGIKVQDQIQDQRPSRKWAWRLLGRFAHKKSTRAEENLRAAGADTRYIHNQLDEQQKLEKQIPTKNTWKISFQPTANITGEVYRAAAPDIEWMQTFGSKFGALVYLTDAYLDWEKDAATGNYNPLLINREKPSDEILQAVLQEMLLLRSNLSDLLKMHAPDTKWDLRLTRNLTERVWLEKAGNEKEWEEKQAEWAKLPLKKRMEMTVWWMQQNRKRDFPWKAYLFIGSGILLLLLAILLSQF